MKGLFQGRAKRNSVLRKLCKRLRQGLGKRRFLYRRNEQRTNHWGVGGHRAAWPSGVDLRPTSAWRAVEKGLPADSARVAVHSSPLMKKGCFIRVWLTSILFCWSLGPAVREWQFAGWAPLVPVSLHLDSWGRGPASLIALPCPVLGLSESLGECSLTS